MVNALIIKAHYKKTCSKGEEYVNLLQVVRFIIIIIIVVVVIIIPFFCCFLFFVSFYFLFFTFFALSICIQCQPSLYYLACRLSELKQVVTKQKGQNLDAAFLVQKGILFDVQYTFRHNTVIMEPPLPSGRKERKILEEKRRRESGDQYRDGTIIR